MNQYTLKTRLENLIKSNQSVHTICESHYNNNDFCTLSNEYSNFKCWYYSNNKCMYHKFTKYNIDLDTNIGDC